MNLFNRSFFPWHDILVVVTILLLLLLLLELTVAAIVKDEKLE
jgi:hypothetical protein